MLNNRKRFVFSAAMAAAFVLLAGGANALAITTWTVSKTSTTTTCSTIPLVTTCNTIQSAVTAASSGDVILVGPGTYNESVMISESGNNRDGLTLLGAQAGRDAREGRHEAGGESVVNSTGTGNPAIVVNAWFVVIDGFTVTGDSTATPPAGIVVGSQSSGYYWAQLLNNTLVNNGTGIYLYRPSSDSTHYSFYSVIEHNLFKGYTVGTGANVGIGIFSNGATNPVITENAFTGNKAVAIIISGGDHAEITNNTSEDDGAFVVYVNAMQSVFSHNSGRRFGHKGVPVLISSNTIYPDAAIDIGPNNFDLVISDNDLEEGESHISNGIAFTSTFPAALFQNNPNANYYVTVKNNRIRGFPENGIVAETLPNGTLTYSWILGNEVLDNGADGISIQDSNYNNTVLDNRAEGNAVDCYDGTTEGGGTLGAQDIWLNDAGNSSNLIGPPPLCTPGRWHDHDSH
jgi:parallel beta-helix repeat protein